jgi:hypothetical protein
MVGRLVLVRHSTSPPRGELARRAARSRRGDGWDPPRRLAYTWSENSTDSEVSFELSPIEGGVALVLTHRQLPLGEEIGFGGGWHASLDALGLALGGARPAEIKAAWNATPQWEKPYTAAFADIEARKPMSPADIGDGD